MLSATGVLMSGIIKGAKMDKFWIVCKSGCEFRAIVKHETRDKAVDEAERLTKDIGGKFLVFELIGEWAKVPVPISWVRAK